MKFQLIPLPLLAGVFLGCGTIKSAEPVSQADAVVELLNLFSARPDARAVANAGKLLSSDVSPSEILAADLHSPPSNMIAWSSPDTTSTLISSLGRYVAQHAGEMPARLPSPESIKEPLRLAPFFIGLFQPTLAAPSLTANDFIRISPLLDDAWLDTASNCGAIYLQQLLLTHRGQLQELLLSYQKSGDDTALIILGETLASDAKAYLQIKPKELHPKTLALLLSGSLGAPNSSADEQMEIITTAARWTQDYPQLIELLRDIRDPASLALLEAEQLWQKDRKASIKQLALIRWSPWTLAKFVQTHFQDSGLSESEAVPLIQSLSTEILVAWSKQLKSKNAHNIGSQFETRIMNELESRNYSGKATQ